MQIGQFCSRNVVLARRSSTVKEAAQIMREHHVGDLVVIDEHTSRRIPCGMITDRDIAVAVVAKGIDPNAVKVSQVMSTQLVVGQATDGVAVTARVMRAKGVRRIPVVDPQGELVGILTADDLVGHLGRTLTSLAAVSSAQQHLEAEARK